MLLPHQRPRDALAFRCHRVHPIPKVRRRIHISLVLALCVVGTGAQWDVVQVFAWVRMTVNYSRAMPVEAAVARTFDGEMCSICRLVANAKKQEQSRSSLPEIKVQSKQLLFCQIPSPLFIEVPLITVWRPCDTPALAELNFAPSVPPPRGVLA
jgi:hypothetical protein